MDDTAPRPAPTKKPVERLFPFALRSRVLIVGRETLARSKSKLHFILVTTDLSENSVKETLQKYSYYPIVQRYTSVEIEKFFGLKSTKILGFQKSDLAKSIYAELKEHRLNSPMVPPNVKKPKIGKTSETACAPKDEVRSEGDA